MNSDRIKAHLQQLSPHQKRKTARLLEESLIAVQNCEALARAMKLAGNERDALRTENEMLRLNMTLHRYSHDEIECACGGETALIVREKVMKRRAMIVSENEILKA